MHSMRSEIPARRCRRTIAIDRTAPASPVVSGGSDSWVTSPLVVSAAGSTDAGSGLAGYQSRESMDAGASWSSAVSGASVGVAQAGATWLQFRAVDKAGNVSPWAPATLPDAAATVLLDDVAPSVPTLTGGGSGWTSAAHVDVFASGSVDALSGPVGYEFATSADAGATWSAWTPGADAAVASEGQTLVRFRALDALGNASTPVQTTVAIDRTPPTVALTAPTSGSTVSGNVTVTASAADTLGLLRVEFLVDGVVAATDTAHRHAFSWNAGSGTGSHTLTARAVDGAGNQAVSAAATVTVGSAVTTFTTLPAGSAGLPQGDSSCAGQVTTDPWEPRPDNHTANHDGTRRPGGLVERRARHLLVAAGSRIGARSPATTPAPRTRSSSGRPASGGWTRTCCERSPCRSPTGT